jgi:hypothetical protein
VQLASTSYDPKGTLRVKKTDAQVAREKYESETEPTPKMILDKFPGSPQRMKAPVIEGMLRVMESGNNAEANRIAAQAKADEDRAFKADQADQNRQLRKDIAASKSGSDRDVSHQLFQDETAMRKEYEALPTVKAYNVVKQQTERARSAYQLALKAQKDGKSANSADQAIITVLNKVLDPQSVVRESEYARTADGQAVMGRLEGSLDKMKRGGAGISASERDSIMQAIGAMEGAMSREHDAVLDHYRGIAQQYGFNPERIIPGKSSPSAPPSAPKQYQQTRQGSDGKQYGWSPGMANWEVISAK